MKKVKIVGNPIIKGEIKFDAQVEIPLPSQLNDLALSKDGDDWDLLCKRLPSYGFINPIGNLHISHLVVDGKEMVFH